MGNTLSQLIEAFFSNYKTAIYKKGEILVHSYDNPKGIFFIKKGMVKMYVISKKGDELTLTIFKPKSFFPMSWALNGGDNTYFYEAMMSTEVQIAPKEDVLQFLRKNPDVTYDLLQRVYRGVDGLLMRMGYLMSGDAYPRLVIEILIAGKRFGGKNEKSIILEMSEKDLAASSGMSRETVSREMKKLKIKGLIDYKNKEIIIPDVKKLEQELL